MVSIGCWIGSASAPVDEAPITPAAALNSAHAAIQRGEGIPHEEILREFGLASR